MSGEFGIFVHFPLLGVLLGGVLFTLSLFLFPMTSDCIVIMLSLSLGFLLLLSSSFFFFFSSSWYLLSSGSGSDSTSLSSFLLGLASSTIEELFSFAFSSKFTVRDFFLLGSCCTPLEWFDQGYK
uniref:Uncharacterized protein n=1 Tax=Cacopsylla melanoneura TaxID=428564 RepID=A0A8D8LGL1_9HEMI